MNLIPVTIVDDFFDDPDSVVEYAMQLNFDVVDPTYPGKRTQCLSKINYEFYSQVLRKFNFLFSNNPDNYCECNMHFQLVEKEYEIGVVHKDYTHTGIVYLTKNTEQNSGTSIYEKKTEILIPDLEVEQKKFLIENKLYDQYKEQTQRLNTQFRKTIDVKDEYNRLIAFDGCKWHAANSFSEQKNTENRLTLVFFVRNWALADSPLLRMTRSLI